MADSTYRYLIGMESAEIGVQDGGLVFTTGSQKRVFLNSDGSSTGLSESVLAWFNVKDYGAKGDGTTDDTAAIQAAITACQNAGGGIVYLPIGNYKISSPLLVTTDKVRLVGTGPGISFAPPSGTKGPCVLVPTGAAAFAGSSVIRFSQGGGATRSLWGCGMSNLAINCTSLPANCDAVYAEVTQSRFTDNVITGPATKAFHFEGFATDGWNNHIERNYVQGCLGDFIYFGLNAPDSFVTDNTCYAVGGNGVNCVAPGIKIEGNHLLNITGNAVSGSIYETKVLNNRIEDCNGGVYLSTTGTSGYAGFMVVGNKIWNCSIAADNTTDSINVTASATSHGGIIEGNGFYTNEGSTNGGTAGAKNRARYHINIASSNVNDVVVGPNSYLGFNNAASSYGTAAINDGGTRTTISGIVLAKSAVANSHTGDTTETTLASATIPGGLLGKNGRVRVYTLWSMPNNANNKSMRVRLGGLTGSQFQAVTVTADASAQMECQFANRGALNSQVGNSQFAIIPGASTNAVFTASVDTSVDQVLAITAALGVGTDTLTLESYLVEIFPG